MTVSGYSLAVGLLSSSALSDGVNIESSVFDFVVNNAVIGIILFLVLTERLVTPAERDRLRAEVEESRAQVEALNENIRTEVIPLVIRSLEATSRNTEVTEKVIKLLELTSQGKGA